MQKMVFFLDRVGWRGGASRWGPKVCIYTSDGPDCAAPAGGTRKKGGKQSRQGVHEKTNRGKVAVHVGGP